MFSVSRKIIFALSCYILTVFFYITPAQAHEPRLVAGGALNIVVGWRTEPAFEKNTNAFDFIVTDEIDVTDIELDVYVMYLDEDAPDAKVIKAVKLTDELRRDRTNPNRFNKYLLPSKAGAYGFHVMGMVNGNAIDEIFICRGGTKNTEGRSFGCIEKPQRFPGGGKRHHDDEDDD